VNSTASAGILAATSRIAFNSFSASAAFPFSANAIPREKCQCAVVISISAAGRGYASASSHLWNLTFTMIGYGMNISSPAAAFTFGPTFAASSFAALIAPA